MKQKNKYYTLKNILKACPTAKYYVIYGERSNGKTFAPKFLMLFGYHEDGININGYLDNGDRGAVIRRFDEDFKGNRGPSLFDDIWMNKDEGNILAKRTKGKWNKIIYRTGGWWLVRVNEKNEIEEMDTQCFAYRFSIASWQHDKSSSYPKVYNILFDEFIAKYYLPDECMSFWNVVSTLVRDEDKARVFMCGNTISPHCPYFNEMGITKVKYQNKGSIDIYTYSNPGLLVACEYSDFPAKKKASDVYFAFDNPKLKMITSGEWEIDVYPHLPIRYEDKDIMYTYFIIYDGEIVQCEVVYVNNCLFTYCHRKTTPIQKDNTNIVFQIENDPRPWYSRNITKPRSKMFQKLYMFFQHDQVYYQDNMLGETIRAYLQWCVNQS